MKLVYPENGLKNKIGFKLDNVKKDLYNAKASCNYDVPSTFQYTSYVRGLYNLIGGYITEIEKIESKLERVDFNYSDLEDSVIRDNSAIEVFSIKERERMIV